VNIQIQAGSPQQNSLSLRVAKAIARHVGGQYPNTSIVDFNKYDIPFINQGRVQRDNLTPFQQELLGGWENAQLIFVISPEYNWFPSAELVNMLHQLGSRQNKSLFDGKVFAFVGVSNGRGGRIPTMQLTTVYNKLINVLATQSVSSAKTFESQFTQNVLDEEGHSLGNAEYDKGLAAFIDYSVDIAKRWVLQEN
jgi:chromate reductase, NAD(P)H dehydrogenase (quinone)